MKRLATIALTFLLSACLKFGDNVELSGTAITQPHVENIARTTMMKFPAGTVWQNYYYHGDTIDPAFIAKLSIPADKRAELLTNEVFTKGKKGGTIHNLNEGKIWWKPEKLTNRLDKSLFLPKGQLVECSLGEEDGQLILYLVWISI